MQYSQGRLSILPYRLEACVTGTFECIESRCRDGLPIRFGVYICVSATLLYDHVVARLSLRHFFSIENTLIYLDASSTAAPPRLFVTIAWRCAWFWSHCLVLKIAQVLRSYETRRGCDPRLKNAFVLSSVSVSETLANGAAPEISRRGIKKASMRKRKA